MDLSVNRSYRSFSFEKTDGFESDCVMKNMTFHIEASGITKEEEIDIVIRQLQQLRQEIADGCTKPIICPIERSGQIK